MTLFYWLENNALDWYHGWPNVGPSLDSQRITIGRRYNPMPTSGGVGGGRCFDFIVSGPARRYPIRDWTAVGPFPRILSIGQYSRSDRPRWVLFQSSRGLLLDMRALNSAGKAVMIQFSVNCTMEQLSLEPRVRWVVSYRRCQCADRR